MILALVLKLAVNIQPAGLGIKLMSPLIDSGATSISVELLHLKLSPCYIHCSLVVAVWTFFKNADSTAGTLISRRRTSFICNHCYRNLLLCCPGRASAVL